MEFFHGRIQAFIRKQRHQVCSFVDVLANRCFVVARRALEYVIRYVIFVTRVPDAQTQAHEISTAVANDVAQTIVPAVSTTLLELHRARGRSISS